MTDEPTPKSPTRRVALGALGLATAAAVAGAAGAFDDAAPAPAGGAANGNASGTPVRARSALQNLVEADLRRAETGRPDAPVSDQKARDPQEAATREGRPDAPTSTAARTLRPHPDDPSAPDSLEQRAILRGGTRRRVLYTWTTEAQIDALRAGGRLLHRSRSVRHGRSRFDQLVRGTGPHPMQAVLRDKPFRRFAWPYPWATLMGWPSESYGQHLLRVELAPCSMVTLTGRTHDIIYDSFADTTPARGVWGKSTGAPSKVGVVFHEHETHQRDHDAPKLKFSNALREYVLFSEEHIERFSYGTAACRAAMQADIALLERMIAAPPWPSDRRFRYFSGWPESVLDRQDAYKANLALFNVDDAYEPRFLRRVIDELTKVLMLQGKPFERLVRH